MLQPGALPRRALLHSFYIGGGINFMAKQRFQGSLDAHHVLLLPRVHGHDQQRRGMLLFTSCKGWSRLLKGKKKIPLRAAKSLFLQLYFCRNTQQNLLPSFPALLQLLPFFSPFPSREMSQLYFFPLIFTKKDPLSPLSMLAPG